MTTSSDDLIGLDDGAGPGDGNASAREIAELRRQLLVERERSLNATDRVLGAQAEAAQARAQIKELEYVLHVREAELARLKERVDQMPPSPLAPVTRRLRAVADRGAPVIRNLGQRLGAIGR